MAELADDEATPASVPLSGTGVPPNAGPTGPTGAAGAAGANGVTGPSGPRGPTGKAGESRPVTCKTVTVVDHGKRVKRQKCTTKTITGTASFTIARARATLTRGSVTYATGTASAQRLTLHALRAIRDGRYTLTLRRRVGGRKVTTRQSITIARSG